MILDQLNPLRNHSFGGIIRIISPLDYFKVALREKRPNREFFCGPCFSAFGLNTGKKRPGKTLYLGPFHAVSPC